MADFEESLGNLNADEMCFIKALDAGCSRVIDEIGSMYEYGHGVEKNKIETVKWYKRGAEIGDTYSMNDFAECLIRGSGTEKNIDAAIEWYVKAAESGNLDKLNQLATYLIKYKHNELAAYAWLKKKYPDNKSYALKALAEIYYFKLPEIEENNLRAFDLYKKLAYNLQD